MEKEKENENEKKKKKKEKEKKEEKDVMTSRNLTSLTWQVGNKCNRELDCPSSFWGMVWSSVHFHSDLDYSTRSGFRIWHGWP